jgi:hypothetical protein
MVSRFLKLSLFLIVVFLAAGTAAAGPRLSWDPSSGDVQGYKVHYGESSASYSQEMNVGNQLECALSDLSVSDNTKYYFAVTAYNDAGESDFSNEVSWESGDSTPPMMPQGFSVSVEAGRAILKWQPNAEDDVNGYYAYCGEACRSYAPPVPVNNETTYTMTNLEEGKQYFFAVSAVDTAGNESGYSNEIAKTIPKTDTTAPTVAILSPTNQDIFDTNTASLAVSGTAQDDTGVVRVTWQDSNGGSGTAEGTADWTIATVNLVEGDNTITVTAEDGAGNTAGKQIMVRFIPPDTTPPSVVISQPTTQATFDTQKSTVAIGGTAADEKGVTKVTWHSSNGENGIASGTSDWTIAAVNLNKGDNTITVTAEDAAGNTAGKQITVRFTPPDTTPPSVVISQPTTQATFNTQKSTVAIGGIAADEKGVTKVTWRSSNGQSGTASGTADWTIAAVNLTEGSNIITVTAEDAAGNTAGKQITVRFTPPDTTPPSVVISQPTTQATFNTQKSTVAIGGIAADEKGVTKVTWRSSNGQSGTASGTADWTIAAVNLTEGSNIITVTAEDAAGNTAGKQITVRFTPPDTTPPTVAISTPTGQSSYATESAKVDIGGTASDDTGITRITWRNANGGSGTASGTKSWSIAAVSLTEGDNRITVTAEDAAGNKASAQITVRFTPPDTTPPTVAISTPTGQSSYATKSNSLDIGGTASDDTGITRITWRNATGGSGTASGTKSWSIAAVNLTEGDNRITVTAEDAAGYKASAQITVRFTPPDTTPPTVAISTPTGQSSYATESAKVDIGGTASDDRGISLVKWRNSTGGSGTASGTRQWQVSGINLKEGDNKITVEAVDEAGNAGRKTLKVTYANQARSIDNTPPTISLKTPTSGSSYEAQEDSLTVEGSASDSSAIDRVTWRISNGGYGTAVGTNQWKASAIPLVEGENEIIFTAVDTHGNQGIKRMKVSYNPESIDDPQQSDTTQPTISFTSPTTGSTFSTHEDRLNLEGRASGTNWIISVTWRNSNGTTGTAFGTNIWKASGIQLSEGENVITITAMDLSGKIGTRTLTVNFTPKS